MLNKYFGWFSRPLAMPPVWRIRVAWLAIIGSTIAWPLTQITVGRGEPPIIFGLSWFAITITAWDVLVSTQVSVNVEEAGSVEHADKVEHADRIEKNEA